MTEWNFDLTQAPRDGRHVILATEEGKVIRSYWVKPKADHAHWCMLSHKNNPVAFMLWPEHPFQAKAGEEPVSTMSAGSSDPVSRTDDASFRQGSSTVEFTDDCRQGGKEASAAASHPDHFILDDVGGGE
jgi:hypothetical protein